MPRRRFFNADEASSLQGDVVFKLCGKEFNVLEVTDELIEEVTASAQPDDDEGNDDGDEGNTKISLGDALKKQLAIFTGESPEAFDEATIREMSGTLSWIMDTLTDPRGMSKAKNLQKR